MTTSIRAIVRAGEVRLLEQAEWPEGTLLLVVPLEEDAQFWTDASGESLAKIWDNSEDDVYETLLLE